MTLDFLHVDFGLRLLVRLKLESTTMTFFEVFTIVEVRPLKRLGRISQVNSIEVSYMYLIMVI